MVQGKNPLRSLLFHGDLINIIYIGTSTSSGSSLMAVILSNIST